MAFALLVATSAAAACTASKPIAPMAAVRTKEAPGFAPTHDRRAPTLRLTDRALAPASPPNACDPTGRVEELGGDTAGDQPPVKGSNIVLRHELFGKDGVPTMLVVTRCDTPKGAALMALAFRAGSAASALVLTGDRYLVPISPEPAGVEIVLDAGGGYVLLRTVGRPETNAIVVVSDQGVRAG